MRSFIHVARLVLPIVAALIATPTLADCGATAQVTSQDMEGGTLHATGTGTGANCFQSYIYIDMRVEGQTPTISNTCPTNTTCTATGTLAFTCRPPGTYTIQTHVTCFKDCGNGCCAPDTDTTYEFPFVQQVRPLSGTLALGRAPNGNYVINATYTFPWTAYTCRAFLLRDRDTGWDVGGIYMPTYTGSGTSGEVGGGCAGKEIYGVGGAVVPEETRELGSVSVPPDILKDTNGNPLPRQDCAADRASKSDKKRPTPCPGGVPCVGDPINIASGDVFQTVPLFSIAQPTTPLEFALTFHSKPLRYPARSNEMGLGWHHNFNARLTPIGAAGEMLYYVDGEGLERFFMETTSGTWVAARPIGARETVALIGGYRRLQFPDGSYDSFYPDGRWASSTDRWGNAITAQYNANLDLIGVTDPLGRTITIVVSGRNLLSMTLPGGEKWEFTYDVNGNLSKIFDPLHPNSGPTATPWRSFTYSANTKGQHRLLMETRDEANAVVQSHTYDSQDRGIQAQSGSGRDLVTVEYGSGRRVTHSIDGVRTQVTDFSLGIRDSQWGVTAATGEACATCTHSGPQTLQLDDYGRPTRVTSGGIANDATYDSVGNVLTRTEAAGTALARTTSYAYGHPTWKTFVTSETSPGPFGNRVTMRTLSADEQTLTTTVSGRLAAGGPVVTYTTVTTFDSRHRVLTIDGPRTDVSDVETREYYPDDDANLARRGRLKKITAPGGLVTTFDDYDSYGTARSIVDANGVVSTLQTDNRGRVTTSTSQSVAGDPNETSPYASTTAFDGRDRLTHTINARNIRTGFTYEDGTNRLTSTIRYDASGNQVERLLLTLNLLGWKTREEAQICTAPAPTCTSWSTRRSDEFAYDDHGRLTTTTHDDATSIAYTYDAAGRIATIRDENHASANTTYGYDDLSRLHTVTQTWAGAPGNIITTTYNYDVQDNLISVTDPNGNVTTYDYDDFGRLVRQVSPVTGTTSYAYDGAGNVTSTTDSNGAATTRSYDAANRITTATSSRGGSTETVTYTYDDTTANTYRRGRLSSMTDPTGSTTYSYDRRGLLRQESKTIQGATYTSAFGYDANGNRTSITYPSGRVVTYTFDFADRPSSAASGGTTLASAATYAPFGPLTQFSQGNGAVVARQFDQRYRITQNKLTRSGATIAQYDYGYDNAGNITSITDAIDGAWSRTFVYDDLHRLTTANSGSALWVTGTYGYDRMGNLTAAQLGSRSRTFSYQGMTPKLASVTEGSTIRSVTYDPAGNEATVGTASFSYSPRNSLAGAEHFTYIYDGRGVRTVTAATTGGVALATLSVAPGSIVGGSTATGTVTLTAPAASNVSIGLVSENQVLATVPASVSIATGNLTGTFPITTIRPQSSSSVTIRATLAGSQRSATLTVLPGVELSSLSLFPGNAVGTRMHPTGTVTLSSAAPPGGASVTLTSSDTTAATVPTSITVPEGQTSATFAVTTKSVGSPTSVTVTATYGTTRTASVTVSTCATWNPTLAGMPAETVWFDDALPAGAINLTRPWYWDTVQKQSGTQSGLLRYTDTAAWTSMGFESATSTLSLGMTDQIVAYTLLDPCAPPDTIMFQFKSCCDGWVHRAYWGQRLLFYGTEGTSQQRPMGPLPPVGVWNRLTIPAPAVGLADRQVDGIEVLTHKNGSRVWFDRIGKSACSVGTVAAPASLPAGDQVWIEDVFPSGATTYGTYTWDATKKASGTQSHHGARAYGEHYHGFQGGSNTMTIATGDVLFAYVLIDPCDPPGQIMLQWFDGATWNHRAFWGADLLTWYGQANTNSRRYAGPMPKRGEWVRLEIPASRVGLEGVTVSGLIFLHYDGHAWFDRVGETSCSMNATTPTPPLDDVVWFDDALPSGACPGGTWTWDTAQKATGTQSHVQSGLGVQDRYFQCATPMSVAAGEKLVQWVLIDPCNPPVQLMLSFNYGTPQWSFAYWGADIINAPNEVFMGELPPAGQWVRLEIPAAPLGLEGKNLVGMQFRIVDGRAWWDRTGKAPAQSAMLLTDEPPAMMLSSSSIDESPQAKPSLFARFRTWLRALRKPRPPASLTVTMEPAQLPQVSNTAGVLQRYSFYTPELNLLAETQLTQAATPAIEYEYVWFNGEPLAQIETATGTILYYFNDHLGAPLLTTNTTGVVDWRVEREPYGTNFATRAGAERHQPLSLPGQEYDPNQPERAYNIFRWYRGGWGRYSQADPLLAGSMDFTGFPYELNPVTQPFSYAVGNPNTYADPLGLYVDPRPIVDACVRSRNPWIIGGGLIAAALLVAANSYDDAPPPGPPRYKQPCDACHGDEESNDDSCILVSIQEDIVSREEFAFICHYLCKDGTRRYIYRKPGDPQCRPIRGRNQPWDNPTWEQDLW